VEPEHASISTTAELKFGDSVTHSCADGHTVGGISGGSTSYTGSCGAAGAILWSGEATAPHCEPVSCGMPPSFPHAQVQLVIRGRPCEDMEEELVSSKGEKECSSLSKSSGWDDHIVARVNARFNEACPILKGRSEEGARDQSCSTWCQDHGNRQCLFAQDNKYSGCDPADYDAYSQADVESGTTCTWNHDTSKADCDWSDNGCNEKWGNQICGCAALGSADQPPAATTSVTFGDPDLLLSCDSGFSLGGTSGGDKDFHVRCQADGTFSSAPDQCQEPMVSVEGEVTDAQDESIKLSGVKVKITKNGIVADTVYSDSSGLFRALSPLGIVSILGSKADFIDQNHSVTVNQQIRKGQGADLALSKLLAPGMWRTVLTWAGHSKDLDSHTYFGTDFDQHVYYPSRSRTKTSTLAGEVIVTLDRDETKGYGPETTTFSNVGHCLMRGSCLIKFKVKNFTPNDGAICDSKAKITVYRGAVTDSTFEINHGCGVTGKTEYVVYTLDASQGIPDDRRVLPGDKMPAPYLDLALTMEEDWTSMSMPMWSTVTQGFIVGGFFATPGEHLSNIERVKGIKVKGMAAASLACQEVDWSSSFSTEGWSECPDGYFLAGILRKGSEFDKVHGIDQIEKGRCCKAQELPSKWGTCEEKVFNSPDWGAQGGWRECGSTAANGKPSAVAGLYRVADPVQVQAQCKLFDGKYCSANPYQNLPLAPGRSGGEVARIYGVTSAAACSDKCSDYVPGCTHYTYTKTYGDCLLYDTCPAGKTYGDGNQGTETFSLAPCQAPAVGISGITKAKCCEFAEVGLVDAPEETESDTDARTVTSTSHRRRWSAYSSSPSSSSSSSSASSSSSSTGSLHRRRRSYSYGDW